MLLSHKEFRLSCLLFDMDGTLIDSHAPMVRAYTEWAHRYGLDPATVVFEAQGRRTIDTIRLLAPAGVDVEADAAAVARREREDLDGVVAIPGAAALLESIPAGRWALVTSADRGLAITRLEAAGLPLPSQVIGAEDVVRGKPAPDGYLKAAQLLGREITRAMVFEDAPAGLAAGIAAGARVVAIRAMLSQQARAALGEQDYLDDLRPLSLTVDDDDLVLRVA